MRWWLIISGLWFTKSVGTFSRLQGPVVNESGGRAIPGYRRTGGVSTAYHSALREILPLGMEMIEGLDHLALVVNRKMESFVIFEW